MKSGNDNISMKMIVNSTILVETYIDGNTLDKCASNKTHNKNIKNTHVLRTITNPGIHAPPSYVVCDIDARTAFIVTIYDTAYLPYS